MLIYQSAMPHRLEKSGKILTDVTRLGIPTGLMNCTMVLQGFIPLMGCWWHKETLTEVCVQRQYELEHLSGSQHKKLTAFLYIFILLVFPSFWLYGIQRCDLYYRQIFTQCWLLSYVRVQHNCEMCTRSTSLVTTAKVVAY